MDLDLSPEHELIRSTVREFAEQRVAPVAAELDREARFPYELVAEVAFNDVQSSSQYPGGLALRFAGHGDGHHLLLGIFALGFGGELLRPAAALMGNLYRMLVEKDCSLAEINPLVVTRDGKLIAGYGARVEPLSQTLIRAIEAALGGGEIQGSGR